MRKRVLSCLFLSVFFFSISLAAYGGAKNAILFIGDGMGMAQVTAARIFEGNARDGKLTLDTFENVAVVRTYCANMMVTDSAAAGTAIATGHKTTFYRVGMSPDGEVLETLLESAKKAGKSVGIVTTTGVTHATPASFYAHIESRGEEAQIAAQLVDYGQVDVVMGGGRRYFIPEENKDAESGAKGARQDGRDLLAEARAKGYRLVQKQSEFDDLLEEVEGGGDPGKVLALFSPSHMAYEVDRAKDTWGEPSLEEMAKCAIAILSRNPKGYFLMVEGGRIDHAAHANEGQSMLTEVLCFDRAVKAAVQATDGAKDTLIVVTADHETGGLTINGYAGIEVEGTALFSTPPRQDGGDILSFSSGPGANRDSAEKIDHADPHYRQPALVRAPSASHTGVDVLAWAAGPGAETFRGTIDNTDVAKKIRAALELD